MFERFTEKARRVIFFARYEASQFGQPYIESEHLLLGVLREDPTLVRSLPELAKNIQWIRDQIDAVTPIREKVSTSVDLPLSNESKRVLVYAAEEADVMGERHVSTEHLLLGLLRETNCLAGSLLRERGITLEKLRDTVRENRARQPETQEVGSPSSWHGVEIHGTRRRQKDVVSRVTELQPFYWERATWKPRDVLVRKQDGRISFFNGQPYDAASWELKKSGWMGDYCRICGWQLFESANAERGAGYTNGREWICLECYDKFIAPHY